MSTVKTLIHEDTAIRYTIKALKDYNGGKAGETFQIIASLSDVEDEGLASCLIDGEIFDSMGHPCESFEVVKREFV